LKYRAYH